MEIKGRYEVHKLLDGEGSSVDFTLYYPQEVKNLSRKDYDAILERMHGICNEIQQELRVLHGKTCDLIAVCPETLMSWSNGEWSINAAVAMFKCNTMADAEHLCYPVFAKHGFTVI